MSHTACISSICIASLFVLQKSNTALQDKRQKKSREFEDANQSFFCSTVIYSCSCRIAVKTDTDRPFFLLNLKQCKWKVKEECHMLLLKSFRCHEHTGVPDIHSSTFALSFPNVPFLYGRYSCY